MSFKKGDLVNKDFLKLDAEVVRGPGKSMLAPHSRTGTSWPPGSESWIPEQNKQSKTKDSLMRVGLVIHRFIGNL